tara:strand:+ start:11835 stop:12563 length:729 start_codon:yes stop_codon:yes gene_type:complete
MLFACFATTGTHADWTDLLDNVPDAAKQAVSSSDVASATGLSQTEIVAGLKEALDNATAAAVSQLAKPGGFLDNPQVRIPLPSQLDWVEKGLRKVGQEELADNFINTMNQAAEEAVPAALEQFQGAINAMSVEDARGILNGPDDAATEYFRKHSESTLREQFLPIVKETTAGAEMTSAYKNMTAPVAGLGGMFGGKSLDVDEYVTDKALDGLFTMVAQEEARIRKDPVARSTELLKKVFGGN